jgi:hypothetical protein
MYWKTCPFLGDGCALKVQVETETRFQTVFQHHMLFSKSFVNRSIVSSHDSTTSEITGYKLDSRGLIPGRVVGFFFRFLGAGAHMKGHRSLTSMECRGQDCAELHLFHNLHGVAIGTGTSLSSRLVICFILCCLQITYMHFRGPESNNLSTFI